MHAQRDGRDSGVAASVCRVICCVCGADTQHRGVRVTYDGSTAFPTIFQFCWDHYLEHEEAVKPSAPLPYTPVELELDRRAEALAAVDEIVDAVINAESESHDRWIRNEYPNLKERNVL